METQILTNRETAGLLLLLALVFLVITRPGKAELLRSLRAVLRTLAQPLIAIPIFLYLAGIVGAVALASQVGLWDNRLIKVTILWLLFSGFALFFGLPKAVSEPGFFRQALIRMISVVAVVEVVITLKSFPLWVEIPAQALAVPFAIAPFLVERNEELRPIARIGGWYLVLFGSSALAWSGFHLLRDWDIVDRGRLFLEFLLPLWMTPIALVFVYLLAVFAAYDATFKMMRVGNNERSLVRPRLAVLLRGNVRLGTLRQLGDLTASRIGRTGTLRGAWKEIGNIRTVHRQRRQKKLDEQRRLIDNAGVNGMDEDGRQLDLREFKETCQALRWLAACHMGHYRNRKRYRGDLLQLVASGFARFGLRDDHGVTMRVSRDGQRWYAARQTVTGWWLAVGASGPPPDEWVYDGQTAPPSFPEEGSWDRFGGGRYSKNWD